MALKTASNQNKYENIEMLLLSATYDGFRKKAVLKFYEPKNKEIYLWHDKSDHKPYCLIGRDGIDSNFLDELKTKNNLPGKILKIEKGNLLNELSSIYNIYYKSYTTIRTNSRF